MLLAAQPRTVSSTPAAARHWLRVRLACKRQPTAIAIAIGLPDTLCHSIMTSALAASSSAAAASAPTRSALRRAPGGAALLAGRAAVAAACPRRPSRAAAAIKPLSAAQKQVFTSFSDMIQQSDEPVLVEFYATW